MKTILIFFLIIVSYQLYSQIPAELSFLCATPMPQITQNLTSSAANCTSFNISDRRFDEIFMPISTSRSTIINVNLIFVQRSDGTGNFQQNNTEHQDIINEMKAIINNKFSSIENTTLPNCNSNPSNHTFIPDSKISFEFSDIYIRVSCNAEGQCSEI